MSSPTLPQRTLELAPEITLCQTDLPLDWYQPEFRPYAEEFLALEDRSPASIAAWLDGYVKPAQAHFGDELLLLAHFYMGGEIVKLIQRYGGAIADSYQLAKMALDHPEKKVIVESAVHFMAESIALLAHPDQAVWITNPKAGCTMEMLAKEHMVLPVADQLRERYGEDLVVVAYMNTGGRVKALAGATGGAVCTSANAPAVVRWALDRAGDNGRVLFVPDHHLGRNTASELGLEGDDLVQLPDPRQGQIRIEDVGLDRLDRAKMILWGSECGVHTIFTADMVRYWQGEGYRVLIHPESPLEAVREADGRGSTNFLWAELERAEPGAKLAIGTEGHFVRNALEQGALKGVTVRHLADVPGFEQAGCGCATMSRNDPPHLAGMLDLLRKGEAPDINRVLAGDVVDERTMRRDRVDEDERAELKRDARAALERMIAIVEGR